MSLRSPLSRARGLGAAKEGAHHWLSLRIAAIALVPLLLWFLFSATRLAGADHAAVSAWLSQPLNTVLMLALVATLFYHSLLGTREVVEDYVATKSLKLAVLLVLRFAHVLLAIAGLVAILKVSLA